MYIIIYGIIISLAISISSCIAYKLGEKNAENGRHLSKNNTKIYDPNCIFQFRIVARELCDKAYSGCHVVLDRYILNLGDSIYSNRVDIQRILRSDVIDEQYPDIRVLLFDIVICKYSNISCVMKDTRIGNCLIIAIMDSGIHRKFKIMYKHNNRLEDTYTSISDFNIYNIDLFHIIYGDIPDIKPIEIINYPTFSHNANTPTVDNRDKLVQFTNDVFGITLDKIFKYENRSCY